MKPLPCGEEQNAPPGDKGRRKGGADVDATGGLKVSLPAPLPLAGEGAFQEMFWRHRFSVLC